MPIVTAADRVDGCSTEMVGVEVKRIRGGLLVGSLSLVVIMTSCAKSATTIDVGAPIAVTSSEVRIAGSDSWAREGDRLVADKFAALERSDQPAVNSRPYAYQSRATDVTGPGSYDLEFGPVSESFRYPGPDTGGSLNVPSDVSFTYHWTGVTLSVRGGQRFVVASLVIDKDGFREPYPGFSVWLY